MMRLRLFTCLGSVLLLSSNLFVATAAQANDLERRIRSAIDMCRTTQSGTALAALSRDPDLLTAEGYLDRLTRDPDPTVRYYLTSLLGRSEDVRARQLLGKLVGDDDGRVSDSAIRILFRNARNCAELRSGATVALRDGLLLSLRDPSRAATGMAVVLLGCLPADVVTTQKLDELRKPTTTPRTVRIDSATKLPVAADLALALQGSSDAAVRVGNHISVGDVGTVRFILEATRFVDNSTVLLALAETLKDERVAYVSSDDAPGGSSTVRVSDLAARAFSEKSGVPLPLRSCQDNRQPEVDANGIYAEFHTRITAWIKQRSGEVMP